MSDMQFTGKATIWGVRGGIQYEAVAAPAAHQITQTTIKEDARNKPQLTDGNGEIISEGYIQKYRELTIDLVPIGVTLEDAAAALKLPEYPCKVTTANFDNEEDDGDWIYKGGGSKTQTGDFAKLTITVTQELSSPMTATQLTTIVAASGS